MPCGPWIDWEVIFFDPVDGGLIWYSLPVVGFDDIPDNSAIHSDIMTKKNCIYFPDNSNAL